MKRVNYFFENIKELIFLSSINILYWVFSIVFVSSIFWLIKFNVSLYTFYIGSFLTLMLIFIIFIKIKNIPILKIFASILISCLIIGLSIKLCEKYYDLSWDGNTYHKDAVGAIKNGWNPIYEDYLDFYNRVEPIDMEIIGDKLTGTHGFWQTYYAKATWIFAANIYTFTNDIESSKILNLIVLYALFGVSLHFFSKLLKNNVLSILLSLLLTINPISIVQVFTYYNDITLMAYLFLSIILIIKLYNNKFKNVEDYLLFLPVIIVAINVKFTSFAYVGIFCFTIFLLYIINSYKNNEIKKAVFPVLIIGFSVVFSVFLIGFSPYSSNLLNNRHIFYPLAGENKVDIMSHNQPKDFLDYNNIKKIYYSIFSESDNINLSKGLSPKIKTPFKIKQVELTKLKVPDLRIGGFGVLFSGIFIISIISILYILLFNKTINVKVRNISCIIIITICIMLLLISESWWARYSPYIYLLPTIAIVLLKCSSVNKYFKIVLIIIVSSTLTLNNFYFIKYNLLQNFNESRELRKILNNYENNEKEILIVDHHDSFLGFLYNLNDRGITYKVTTKTSKEDRLLFKYLKYREDLK